MPDEIKGNSLESKPENSAAAVPPSAPATGVPSKPDSGLLGQKPAAPVTKGEQPAAAVAKPAAPAAPPKPAAAAVAAPEAWDAALPAGLKRRFGSAILEAATYRGQDYLVVDPAVLAEVLQILRDEEAFDYCVDITAVHYPQKDRAFELVWILYSFTRNQRVRVKAQFREGESVPSSVKLWPTANWLERECYDMFGLVFAGHPDLRRILLPDGWKGHPLRKDYSILQQDREWVQQNLGIESGQ
jgi:NADH-quinone oxidoreductase subunit C